MNQAHKLEPTGSSSEPELEPAGTAGVGARLRKIRGGMSLESFAAALQVGKSSVSRYENNTRSPDAPYMAAVCDQFGIAAAWLLLGRGPMREGESTAPPGTLDMEALIMAIETVEEGLDIVRGTMNPKKKAAVVASCYELFTSDGGADQGAVLRLVTSAA